ncbi:MAG: hypothetical protein HPY59_18460 [Anaerolineae bacterium]|nr:hypothetical protein [Anaerolineae bacterium]
MKRASLLFWILVIIAAFLTLAGIFALPSSTSKAWLFGLSGQRLTLALFPLLGILFSISMALLGLAAPERYTRITASFRKFFSGSAMLSGGLGFWAALFLAGALIYYRLAIAPEAAELSHKLGALFPALHAYLNRLWPVLMFLAFCLGCGAWAAVQILKAPLFQNPGLMIGCGAGVLAFFATLFQWMVFLFQLRVFEQIPGWYWPIILKPDFTRHVALFGLFFLFSLFILYRIRRFPRPVWSNLALICLLFIGLQYAIGFMEGRGAASLTDRFFLSYHRVYIEEACNTTLSGREAVTRYEGLYPSMFFQTKPPGVLWLAFQLNQIAGLPVLSSLLEQLSGTIPLSEYLPGMVSASCRRSMALATFTFPLLASSTVWILYGFSRRLIGREEYQQLACYSALAFALAPNILMLALFPDQFFYPPLFLLVAWMILSALQRKSFWVCFLIGAALYAVIFLSFSMLPLLTIPVFYLACVIWQKNNPIEALTNLIRTLLPMGLGGLLSMLLFKVFLNYDILTRYHRMMTTRIQGDFYTRLDLQFTGEATWLEKIRQTWEAAKLNNIELAAAVGFPLFIFFVVMGLRSLIHVIQRKPVETAAMNASLFLAYVALNALRVVLGEAARLWMFWVPVMAVLAMQYLLPAIHRSRWLMFVWVSVQFITVFLSYQFQDYLMPQLLP